MTHQLVRSRGHARPARALRATLDPYHSVVYFDPEPAEELDGAGLRGGWMRYFASRSAALGPVPAQAVVAAFYGFRPSLVARALPDAWRFASPEQVLAARLRGADRALRRRLGDMVDGPEVRQAALYAREAVDGLGAAGRVLFAGHAALEWPDEAHLILWHAATLYREYRGDGHVACLVTAEIGPRASLVLHSAAGGPAPDVMRALRGWTEEEWKDAVGELVERGWVEPDGSITPAGENARADIEDQTDRLSSAPWDSVGAHHTERLLELTGVIRAVLERTG